MSIPAGTAEFNDATAVIRGTIAGADGVFSGTFSTDNADAVGYLNIGGGSIGAQNELPVRDLERGPGTAVPNSTGWHLVHSEWIFTPYGPTGDCIAVMRIPVDFRRTHSHTDLINNTYIESPYSEAKIEVLRDGVTVAELTQTLSPGEHIEAEGIHVDVDFVPGARYTFRSWTYLHRKYGVFQFGLGRQETRWWSNGGTYSNLYYDGTLYIEAIRQ